MICPSLKYTESGGAFAHDDELASPAGVADEPHDVAECAWRPNLAGKRTAPQWPRRPRLDLGQHEHVWRSRGNPDASLPRLHPEGRGLADGPRVAPCIDFQEVVSIAAHRGENTGTPRDFRDVLQGRRRDQHPQWAVVTRGGLCAWAHLDGCSVDGAGATMPRAC